MKKIIFSAGGTGGHVFPAVCVADVLISLGYRVRFATDQRGIKYCHEYGNDAFVLSINTSNRLLLGVSLIFNILKTIIIFVRNRPDCVIGFGGYASVPSVLAAQILGIKTIIHEQNAVLGKANVVLARFCKKIITSFASTKNLKYSKKVVHIGNPTRFEKEYRQIKTVDKEQHDKLIILIFGGSQGAKIFAKEVVEAICLLSQHHKIFVFHQAREDDIETIENRYKICGVEYIVSEFFDNIGELYRKSHFVISRAGASSIFEIIGFRKPAILIPYAKSINGDQIENAIFLQKQNAAIVVEEVNLSVECLFNILKKFTENRDMLNSMQRILDDLFVDNVSETIAKEIENVFV